MLPENPPLTPCRTLEVRYHVLATKAFGIASGCVALAVLVGCGEDEPLPRARLRPPIALGGLCSTTLSYCLDETSLLVCQDRIWTERPCAAECGDSGYVAAGCRKQNVGGNCACIPPDAGADAATTECGFTVRRCVDSETIEYCTSAGRVVVSCSSVCAELSPSRRSMGCHSGSPLSLGIDDCVCSLAGSTCTGDPAVTCDGTTFLARCIEGAWQIEDCALACGPDAGAGCSSFANDAGAGCTCGG